MTYEQAIDVIKSFGTLELSVKFYHAKGLTEYETIYIGADELELKLNSVHKLSNNTSKLFYWSLNGYDLTKLFRKEDEVIDYICQECKSALTRYKIVEG